MKKNIGLIGLMAVLCLVLVVLCSCGDAPPETSDTETSSVESTRQESYHSDPEWEAYRQYIADLEPDRAPLPSIEELRAVTLNMSFSEAIALLGKPQQTKVEQIPSSNPAVSALFMNTFAIYETAEGVLVSIDFWSRNLDGVESEPYVFSILYEYPDGTVDVFSPVS